MKTSKHGVFSLLMVLTLSACGKVAPTKATPGMSPVPPPPPTQSTPEVPAQAAPQCSVASSTSDLYLPAVDNSGEPTHALWWKAASRTPCAGIIFVSGVDGGFIEPADEIYTRAATKFASGCVESVFVEYRNPGVLDPSVNDALAGAQFLRSHGVSKMAIVGWSFGGAVIVNSAVQIPEVTTVIGFSPQSRDTEAVANFTNQSLLLFHSHDDENVPFSASLDILEEAPASILKEFHPLDGFDHQLDGAHGIVDPVVMKWLSEKLGTNHHQEEIPIRHDEPIGLPELPSVPICAR